MIGTTMTRAVAIGLALLGSGCGPAPSIEAEAQWVRWMTNGVPMDAAMTPAGDTVVVGRSTGDALLRGDDEYATVARPFIARLDEDGELLHRWDGFLGEARSVATDDRGRAYVALAALRDDPGSDRPSVCELRAFDADDALRWTKHWPDGDYWDCPRDLAIVGDVLVVSVGGMLEGLDLDGQERWRVPMQPMLRPLVPDAEENAVWWADNEVEELPNDRMIARRYDVRDGAHTEIELDMPGWALGAYQPMNGGLLALVASPSQASEPIEARLVSFALDGRRRWSRTVAVYPAEPERGTWSWAWLTLARGGDLWVMGAEQWIRGGDDPPVEHYRLLAQRWTLAGDHEGTLRREFATVEPGSPLERAIAEDEDLIGCDVNDQAARGSWTFHGLSRGEQLVVVGRQGCRDGFVVGLEGTW